MKHITELPYDEFVREVNKIYETYVKSPRLGSKLSELRNILDMLRDKNKKTYIFNILHKEQLRIAQQAHAAYQARRAAEIDERGSEILE